MGAWSVVLVRLPLLLPALALPLPLLLQTGSITVNFRLLPGDTSETIRQQLLQWLGPDAVHADITFTDKWERPAAVTDPKGPQFALVRDAIREAWRLKGQPSEAAAQGDKQHAADAASGLQAGRNKQEQQLQQHAQDDTSLKSAQPSSNDASSGAGLLPVIPYLLCGGTDSKWYANLTSNIVRFAPFSANRRAGGLKRVHGTDERLSVGDFGHMLCTVRAGMWMAGMHMDLGDEAPADAAAAAQHVPAGPGSSRGSHRAAAASSSSSSSTTTTTTSSSSSSSSTVPDEL
jgi:hypothetical protein